MAAEVRPEGGSLGPVARTSGSHYYSLHYMHCVAIVCAAFLFVAGFALLGATARPAQAAGEGTIEIISKSGVHAFRVELATNDEERARGLMFRKELPKATACCSTSTRPAGLVLDAQHLHLARHDLHRGDGRICALPKTPSRCRTTSFLPAGRCGRCSK